MISQEYSECLILSQHFCGGIFRGNLYAATNYELSKIKSTNCFLFNLDIFSTPISIAFNSLFVFFIRIGLWSMKIPFLSIERRVEKASKIAIEARMQNIITRSVLVVKFIDF